LPELDEERLSDLYVRVVEVIEGGSRLPRMKATHGLELLRQQGLLSRVDGAGLVRCGAFSLTRLGSAIAECWIEDESLTRQSLVLLNLLAEIESLAGDAKADEAADAAREAQLKVDGIAAWGRSRHEAWSEYFRAVQHFIRDHVRMDPDRAVSRRLQDAITGWPDKPWTLDVAEARSYLHLRRPDVDGPRVTVRQSSRDRESE